MITIKHIYIVFYAWTTLFFLMAISFNKVNI